MKATQTRADMPQCANIVDEFRAVFGEVKVTYAAENGLERGKRAEGGFVPATPPKPIK